MPLARPISDLRKELQELVLISLPEALKFCNELLPENSEKYNLVLQMRTNLKQLAKEIHQNLISQEENSRRISQISAAFINFVAELEEADFEPPLSQKHSKKNDSQQGSVLYQIPHSMLIGKASYCKVRVAIEEGAILEDIIIDADVRIREHVEVSERMSTELLDTEGKVFEIRPLNSKDQAVRSTGYTQWLFRVTPLAEGEHQLMVKVSLLAFDANTKEYIPRDISVLETVIVVTTAAQFSDEEVVPMKSSGHFFVIGPNPAESNNNSSTGMPSVRALSFFLAFLIFSSSVGWSIARPLERDYFVAAYLQQSPEAYAAFIKEHQDDAQGGVKNLLIEKAYFYKARKSEQLADLRTYQKIYAEQGNFKGEVLEKIATLEWKAVKSIQQKTSLISIQAYLRDFPDATRLPQVMDAAHKMPKTEQAQVIHKIEQAYVRTMDEKPSARKIEQYSQDFPALHKLNKLAEIAASDPAVLLQAQPVLEKIILQRVKTAGNVQQVVALLPSLRVTIQGRPEVLQKVEKAATQNENDPNLSRALQLDLEMLSTAEEVRRKEELEKEKLMAAKKARQNNLNLTRISKNGIELKNTTFSTQKITLFDGSLVVLQPGSSLVYNKKFNITKRELNLYGEALFNVAKKSNKPFIVHAGKLTVEVLGTSFSIKNAEDSKNVLVDVFSGKVLVYAERKATNKSNSTLDRPSVILTPNQRVKYLSSENRLIKSIVEAPKFIISKDEFEKFSFVDAPVSQVFDAIETAYGLEVIYDEVVMRDCTMTTSFDFGYENLHDKLSIICKLLNASYKIVDAQIVIISNGCQ